MFFLLNKPKGISSFGAIRQAQKQLSKNKNKKIKIGHAGTLDPLAEGLLLCAVEEGTKMLSELILDTKEYIATLHLGYTSETDDDEGEKTYISDKIPSEEEIQNTLQKYTGEITQIPPVYSALKIEGKRACDRVRNGESVTIKPRTITIFSIHLLEYKYPYITIKVHCGSGTYIRSLARDIGNDLQTGAYISFLQRTKIGNFNIQDAQNIESENDLHILPFTKKHFAGIAHIISEQEYKDLCNGKYIPYHSEQEEQTILLVKENGDMVGLGKASNGEIHPKKMMQKIIF